ncbi:MAG: ribosomal-processing cysteine protease Prp [Clostridia bacterium]|nr:ribosomal-processing cysteine protease Prp [Clostridia bacterium]
MIKIVIVRDGGGSVQSFNVKGHAGYDAEGRDIICAAASAVAYTVAGYFEEKYNRDGLPGKSCFKAKSGDFYWKRPRITDEKEKIAADAVLEAATVGFRQIEYSYGKKYLVVSEEEVQPNA